MVRARHLVPLLVLAAAVPTSGCSSNGCGSGADSATAAVTAFLTAAPDAGSQKDVCRWVSEVAEADGWKLAQALAAPVRDAGVGALVVEEVADAQEGSVHTVRVAGGALPYSTFLVMDDQGRFVIAPAESMGMAAGG